MNIDLATKRVAEAARRMEAMIPDYSKSGKELKSKIKKEYEEAIEYFNNLEELVLRGDNMGNIQIGHGNIIKNSVISSNSGVVVIGNKVIVNGVEMPPCPAKGHNSTIINNKVYLNGYELVDGEWKRTLRALWHKWF